MAFLPIGLILQNVLIEDYINHVHQMHQINETRRIRRNLRDNSNPFELPDVLFLKLFRLNKICVRDLLEGIEPHMVAPLRVIGIPIHLKVLAALHFFGHGSYQIDVGLGFIFGLSQPSVSRSIEEVSSILSQHFSNRWITFPVTQQQRNLKKERFYEKFNFAHVIGAIDCTHIQIISPPVDHPVHPAAPYYCRKGYYSINTQIICDADYRILNMNARFPGSVHDSAIWIASSIKRHMQEQFVNNNETGFLIGDGGYPLEPWIMVPIPEAQENSPESRFNRALSRTRVVIENVNGILKSRFRCTSGHRVLHYDPIKAAKIIYSCGILHNMALFYNVDMPEDVHLGDQAIPDLPQPQAVVGQNNWHHQGVRIRQAIVNRDYL